jgi:hypothetical protein
MSIKNEIAEYRRLKDLRDI